MYDCSHLSVGLPEPFDFTESRELVFARISHTWKKFVKTRTTRCGIFEALFNKWQERQVESQSAAEKSCR